ncbi:hypothetical protein NKJ88_06120 [Mesorhizobium sp. M0016]|uniref:hypothetical protein n=1 Tax=Mesorhizobium sp. M0016 TaxID=2956843 RepID=UPI00333921E2
MTLIAELFMRFVWPVLKFVIPVPIFAVLVIAGSAWIYNATSIHTAVREAVTEYVHSAQVDALQATVAEKDRQVTAITQAKEELQAKVDAENRADALAEPQRTKDDNAYDAQDKAGACSPTLSDADIEFLLKP